MYIYIKLNYNFQNNVRVFIIKSTLFLKCRIFIYFNKLYKIKFLHFMNTIECYKEKNYKNLKV